MAKNTANVEDIQLVGNSRRAINSRGVQPPGDYNGPTGAFAGSYHPTPWRRGYVYSHDYSGIKTWNSAAVTVLPTDLPNVIFQAPTNAAYKVLILNNPAPNFAATPIALAQYGVATQQIYRGG